MKKPLEIIAYLMGKIPFNAIAAAVVIVAVWAIIGVVTHLFHLEPAKDESYILLGFLLFTYFFIDDVKGQFITSSYVCLKKSPNDTYTLVPERKFITESSESKIPRRVLIRSGRKIVRQFDWMEYTIKSTATTSVIFTDEFLRNVRPSQCKDARFDAVNELWHSIDSALLSEIGLGIHSVAKEIVLDYASIPFFRTEDGQNEASHTPSENRPVFVNHASGKPTITLKIIKARSLQREDS